MGSRHGSQPAAQPLPDVWPGSISALAHAAMDRSPVTGWTHNFYRYPARFSPRFAAAAIKGFSNPGDLIADPYMGGGTTIVEGMVAGRHVVGNDLNSLAAFITKVKITPLNPAEKKAIRKWVKDEVPGFNYRQPIHEFVEFIDSAKTKNLSLVRARFIKKAVAIALSTIGGLPTEDARNFARCALLRVGQWALDGRERHTPLKDFRKKLAVVIDEMLSATDGLAKRVRIGRGSATILNIDAAQLDKAPIFCAPEKRVSLVVTSPPYVGVHVLYHRWQVDGRRETPAPYWIAGCNDGQGASFYNFGDRRRAAADNYFQSSLSTLHSIRRIMRPGGFMVQMVAFSQPDQHLPRYLENMRAAGFVEISIDAGERIWRQVPNRKWHATLIGRTHSAKEVVLIHRAV